MPRVAVLSDTHGLLRPEAMSFLRGSDHIIHAGDIGRAEVFTQLWAIAPVTTVRGNNDRGDWADAIAETELFQIGEVLIYVVHDLAQIDIDPAAAGARVVVSGHSHKPAIEHRDGVLFLNPGSAGPRRFKLPVTMAELIIKGKTVSVRVVDLMRGSLDARSHPALARSRHAIPAASR